MFEALINGYCKYYIQYQKSSEMSNDEMKMCIDLLNESFETNNECFKRILQRPSTNVLFVHALQCNSANNKNRSRHIACCMITFIDAVADVIYEP